VKRRPISVCIIKVQLDHKKSESSGDPTVPLSIVGLGHAVGYSTLGASRQACDDEVGLNALNKVDLSLVQIAGTVRPAEQETILIMKTEKRAAWILSRDSLTDAFGFTDIIL
jgi:hypothetical protein